ncbi:phosphate acetyltransferase [Winogradskyella sediminis]|uniref:Phosphate acetyltransferase n=1 Tax=Winogradskyella sediminis TaxID=1382466 RepID=A0A1H1XFS0_9FLAO|nr:phosphate acetyltransferase [Winogradskyella sediminis]SDT08010.1 phosphate acetyltransferase [Winogradskyella sediminis]
MNKNATNKAIYITTTEPDSGKSVISLGLMQLLLGKAAKVGYFRPIIDDLKTGEIDNHINTVTSYFNLDLNFEDAYAFTRSEVIRLKNEDKDDKIISKIIDKYKAVEERFDFVLIEGSSFVGEGAIIEFDINVLIAKNLGVPAIIIANGHHKTTEDVVSNLRMAYDSFKDKGVEILSVIANKVDKTKSSIMVSELEKNLPSNVIVNAIPLNPILANPSIKEIVEELNAEVLFGESHINNQAGNYSVGAMQLRNYLTHLKDNALVITPGDRADIILGALQAHVSENYPSISGIVLTGGLKPEDSIIKLIEGLSDVVPIISAKRGTFSVTNCIGTIKSQIYAENTQKILTSIKDFETYVKSDALVERLITFETSGITPRMFQYNLLKSARSNKKHIVLPEGLDERILRATKQLIDVDAVEITLLGDKKQIEAKLVMLDIPLDLNRINIINPIESEHFESYANTLYELRKHKNVNLAMAKDLMEDVSYFGTMMVHKGDADGMVSGAVHTTQHTVLPALQFIKTRPETSIVSSIFFMCLEDRVSVYGDCAINPNPNSEQLAEIAISSAATSTAFGIDPKVAMLSYSSGSSGVGEDVERVRKATDIIKSKRPDLKVEGPIQYDAAVDIKVGKTKLPDSEVAGQANVFIFPDLNTGNNTYKAVQRETKALAIGPIIQGLNKPVNDLSRGCTTDDIFNTVIVTVIQAQGL